MVKYFVTLTEEERTILKRMVSRGKRKASFIPKAHVLVASNDAIERQRETLVSHAYHVSVKSVECIRKQFCERGMGIFEPQARKTRSDKIVDGTVEAHILAVS